MKNRPLRNVAWLIAERVARIGLTATVFALVARHLAPADFAQLNLAVTLTAIAAAGANLGLEGLVVRELVRQPERTGAVLGTAFRLRLAGGVGAWVLLGAASTLVPAWQPANAIIWVVGASLCFGPAEVIDLFFQRHLESRRAALARLAAVVAGSLARLTLIVADAPLFAFAVVLGLEAALLALLLAIGLRRSGWRTGVWSWDRALATELVERGLPLAGSGLIVVLALRIDQLLVLSWLGPASAGVYFAAAKLIETVLMAGSAFTLSLFPRLSEIHATAPDEFPCAVQALFDALSALGWVVALGATATAVWFVPLLFGDDYRPAVPALIVLSWGAVVAFNAAARWQYILVAAPTTLNFWCALVGLGVQLAVTPWLLSRAGIVGAAIGWTLGVLASGWATTLLIPSLRGIAAIQSRAFLIPFAPQRWPALLAQFK
jgi:O-antigen/teichoic acid export membrane protein